MCGIVGAVSSNNIVPVLLEGLKRLEYRGYDSCGVAVHQGGELRRARSTARVAELQASVAPDGVLLYETFASGNETVGRPAQPAFLLQPGELLRACASLRVVAYEEGFLPAGIPAGAPERFVQRIVAVREASSAGAPARYLLSDGSR